MQEITISTPYINLDQLLKWAGIIDTGGQIKPMLEDGLIKLNRLTVSQRRKKIYPGDIIDIEGVGTYKIIAE
ncbi:hypothetical protein SDC9_04254 [bioreactor metagenome]|uniref:RNA-binding S4 domain-containing protein n=1 Tax=bioreactor metagenome TaxID=1076179 RepID=A0A644SYA9_9ZZZZ|nr:RNA-binding S4 domain-containing protein [Negativicutes bacterium]